MASQLLLRARLPVRLSGPFLGWVDQAVVSLASFAALLLVARFTDAASVGFFAIGSSILAVLLATQESLVTRPYTIRVHDPLRSPSEFAASALRLSLVLSLVAGLAVAAVALAHPAIRERGQLATVLVLAAAIPFVMLREFARRHAFAHSNMPRALRLDACVAILTVLGLAFAGWTGWLDTAMAFAVIGLSCAAGALAWRYTIRGELSPAMGSDLARARMAWHQGKWFLASQLATQVQGYLVHWMTLLIAGAAVTGVYAACSSVIALANPVLYGYFNGLLPKFVAVLKRGDGRQLINEARRDALVLVALMAAFCGVIGLCGGAILGLLYPHGVYAENAHILLVLALTSLVTAAGVPASLALASADRPRAVAYITGVSVALNIILAWVLLTHYGLLGATIGTLAAEFAGAVARWVMLIRLAPGLRAPTQSISTEERDAATL